VTKNDLDRLLARYPQLRAGLPDHLHEVIRIAARILAAEHDPPQPCPWGELEDVERARRFDAAYPRRSERDDVGIEREEHDIRDEPMPPPGYWRDPVTGEQWGATGAELREANRLIAKHRDIAAGALRLTQPNDDAAEAAEGSMT
jgi:hypothetical protein